MTTFRELVRLLHPDTNGGDYSRVPELTMLMNRRRNSGRCCDCGQAVSHGRRNGKKVRRCGLCAVRARWYPNALP